MINYDDFKILSPEKMDIVAKKYFDALNTSRDLYTSDYLKTNPHFDKMLMSLNNVFVEMSNISKVCTRRFYLNKREMVITVVNKISKIINKYPKKNCSIQTHNYCHAITFCIQELCSVVKNSFNIDKVEQCPEITIIVKECLDLIAIISSLVVECKYRV